MRIINKYLIHDYLVTFFMTLLIFTFVMCVGAIIRAVDLIARGVSPWLIVQAFTYNVPYILTFSIPMSAMTTVLLLFGRMSLDGEITALRSSGLSMWQIISPVIMISIVLTGICVYLNISLAPEARFARRSALASLGVEDPISLLEEGRFVRDFPGLLIYIGSKDGNRVYDVVAYETGPEGMKRHIRAQSGELNIDSEQQVLLIDLYDVRIDQPDEDEPLDLTRVRTIRGRHYPMELDFSAMLGRGSPRKRRPDMTLVELGETIRHIREHYPHLKEQELHRERMAYLVEANERLALAFSCFAFTLLGIPLGMKSRRRESSIGVLISLCVVFFFYLFIIVADALVRHPQFRPDLIIWFPVVCGEIAGFYLIKRQD